MDLDMTQADVVMFRHAGHGGFNVVYRRADGNIGWIDPARAAVRPFAEKGNDSFDLYWVLGRAAQGEEKFQEAIERYQRALVIKGDVPPVLNALGDCCLKTGDRDMAGQAWRRSLAVKPDQPDIRKKLEALK